MNLLDIVFRKWNNISVEKKVIASWIFSLAVIITVSSILYFSKKEIHQSANLISVNYKLRTETQDLLSTIQKLEIISKRFILTGNEKDSAIYFANLYSLEKNLSRLKNLTTNRPRLQKRFLPLENTIRSELYKIIHLPFSLKSEKKLDLKEIRTEDIVYKKLDNYWRLLDAEEEFVTLGQFQSFDTKININLNYFLLLIVIYIVMLSALFLIIISDVRKRRKLAAEVSERRKELKTIIDTAPALIFVKNTGKKFILVNKSFKEFFKVDEEYILQRENKQLIFPADYWLASEEDDAVINQKITLNNIEREIKLADGSTFWLNINKSPLFDDKNNVIGIVGVMDDITKRIEFQNALINSQKNLAELNKQKDKFFSIVAHDLRGPFSGMLGFSGILLEEYSQLTEDEKKNYIEIINSSLKDLLTFIDNLLTWARIQSNRFDHEPKEIDLEEIITPVFQSQKIAAANKQITLESNLPAGQASLQQSLTAFADPGMTETVIRNLVSNAIKFTKTNGKIKVNAYNSGKFVNIQVEDNGIGMSQEIVDNLFNIETKATRNGTNNEKGTGLGLIICKEFIEKNGGIISVKSQVNKGTVISFTLPKNL